MASRLPVLPPIQEWRKFFPRTMLKVTTDHNTRSFTGRIFIRNQALADQFARSIKIREKEIIIEAFPGPGAITRSLLNGGNDGVEFKNLPKPKLVVAVDPSPKLLVFGLGLRPNQAPVIIPNHDLQAVDYDAPVYKSDLEERLILSPSTPYRWPTLTQILSNSLVTEHLEKHGAETTEIISTDKTTHHEIEVAKTKRKWSDPEPLITLVAQIPDATVGEQMVSQWIASSTAADETGKRNWIWEWGRIRMAVLVGKGMYDRIMAKPGELINCKLSILVKALFEVAPLPPYHHVPNVDKSSRMTEGRPIFTSSQALNSMSSAKRAKYREQEMEKLTEGLPLPLPSPYGSPDGTQLPRTITYPSDFHPVPVGYTTRSGDHAGIIPFPRPPLLGIMLTPRENCVIKANQKDEWDYVLRKCFVTEAQSIADSLKNLAFGAEILAPRLEAQGEIDGKVYAGKPVAGKRIVRDLEIDEWQRIVDVFARWPFKPANLILDSKGEQEFSRELGQG